MLKPFISGETDRYFFIMGSKNGAKSQAAGIQPVIAGIVQEYPVLFRILPVKFLTVQSRMIMIQCSQGIKKQKTLHRAWKEEKSNTEKKL